MWRLLRSEIKLNIYTFESCVAALLQLRTPHLPPWLLTQCFNAGPGGMPQAQTDTPGSTLMSMQSGPE